MTIARNPVALPRICVALGGAEMMERARGLVSSFPFLEFRLDTATDPFEAVFEVGAFLREYPAAQVIATCRRTVNGGAFDGTAADEIDMLRQAVAVGAQVVDLSVETAEETAVNPNALLPLRRGRNALMLSWHDFRGTPPLLAVLERMRRIGADLYKIVPTAERLRDCIALFDLLEQHGHEQNLVGMSMGMAGIATRVLGPRFGSRFTFAAAANGAETAPGQVDAATLREQYRVESITRDTEVYGVFGKPISGSRSPVMLGAAFRAAARDAVYLPFETDDADEMLAVWQRLHLAGASVTMPLKETALPLLTELDGVAAKVRAANTLTRRTDGGVRGSNTDVPGILAPLEARMDLREKSALVLGAGGVARAAAFALSERGCHVTIANRSRGRAEALAAETGAAVLAPSELPGKHFDVVLNGTPYGMPTAAMAAPIDFAETGCNLFFDLVYNPIETPLVLAAREHGVAVIPGVEMFLAQGAAQYRTWTGEAAPDEVMREAVLRSLSQRFSH